MMIFRVIFAYLRGHTIVYHFHILNRVNHSLPFSHTQEGEPASRVFVTTYYGFPILNTHINKQSRLLFDA
jgi:hypothetical protein